jgi:hypothetical protein
MRLCSLIIFILVFSTNIFAADKLNAIHGKWVYEPFEDIITKDVIFVVDLSIEYKSDGEAIQTEAWKLKGQENNIWFTLDLLGTWKSEGSKLTEVLLEERLVSISDYEKMPDIKVMKDIIKSVNSKTKTAESIILESNQSRLTTKNIKSNKVTNCLKA